eukprot:10616110-Karenia_brevis.AAC.1
MGTQCGLLPSPATYLQLSLMLTQWGSSEFEWFHFSKSLEHSVGACLGQELVGQDCHFVVHPEGEHSPYGAVSA